MKVFDLLLEALAVIAGGVMLMSLSRGEFFSSKAFVGTLLIAGGLRYLWKHRADFRKQRAK